MIKFTSGWKSRHMLGFCWFPVPLTEYRGVHWGYWFLTWKKAKYPIEGNPEFHAAVREEYAKLREDN